MALAMPVLRVWLPLWHIHPCARSTAERSGGGESGPWGCVGLMLEVNIAHAQLAVSEDNRGGLQETKLFPYKTVVSRGAESVDPKRESGKVEEMNR